MSDLHTFFVFTGIFGLFALALATLGALWWEAKGQRAPKQKLFWLLVLAFTPVFGIVLWLGWGRPRGIKLGPFEIGPQHDPLADDSAGAP